MSNLELDSNALTVVQELQKLMEVDEKKFCREAIIYYTEMLLNNPELIVEDKAKRLRECLCKDEQGLQHNQTRD